MAVLSACDPPPIADPGTTVGGLGGPPGAVALTFDDGPDPTWTPQVLDILDRYGVKGTFFVTGAQVAAHPDLARAIVQRGHSIGNHTWNHPHLTRLSQQDLVDQLAGTSNIIRDATGGYIVSCARPPYRDGDQRVFDTIASLGMRPAYWSVDPNDYLRPAPGTLVSRVLGKVGPDGVVIMHDGGGNRANTVAALPGIIEGLQARGLEITTVCDSRPS